MMRAALAFCVVALLGLAPGCASRQGPLVTGKLEAATLWRNRLTATSNEGGDYAKGSRVDFYGQSVVVSTPDGLNHARPHGYYCGLAIRKG
jgi:hypothetical protein